MFFNRHALYFISFLPTLRHTKTHSQYSMNIKILWSYILYLFILSLLFIVPAAHAQMQYPLTDHISSYYVTSFAEDTQGYIWIGTNHGLNRFSGSNYAVHYSQKDSLSLNNDNISALQIDSDNNLWISTECGLTVWKDGKFKHPQNAGFNIIPRIIELDRKHIIVSDRQGIAKINKETFQEEARFSRPGLSLIKPLAVSDANQIWTTNAKKDATIIYILDADLNIHKILSYENGINIENITNDHEGYIWITTNKGLMCYDADNLQQIDIPTNLQQLCQQEKIHFLMPYKTECLLIGIAQKGMFSYNKQTQTLSAINKQQKLQEESYLCFIDSHHNIWLSDKNTGVLFYPEKILNETITTVQDCLTDPFIKNISIDRENYLWLRTTQDIACYDIQNDQVVYHSSGSNTYGCLFIDSRNDLWTITDYSQLNQYSISKGKPTLKRNIPFQGNVFSICEDKTGKIWATLMDKFAIIDSTGNITYKYAPDGISFSSLYTVFPSKKMFLYTISNGIYEFGDDQQFMPLDIPVTNPNCIHIDRHNAYWIGTYNAGLTYYDPKTRHLQQFDNSSGLIDNNMKSIIEDRQGNIWFSTSTYITKYDIQRKSFSYIYDNHFINGKLYAINCATAAPDGTLYFGGSGGVTVVHPHKQDKEIEDIPLNFDVVLINGKVLPSIKKDITLDYKENMITFWYSGLNFESGTSLSYAYQLDGFDKGWIDAGNNKRVAYSNLPSGKYTFKVRVRKLNGEWSKNELSLNINIHPAPWASPLAITLYWIIGLSALCFVIWLIIRWKVQKERLYLSERQKELSQEHIDFVTNISHEFRTPLSLIYAPLKELVHSNSLNGHDKKLLNTMQRNADRLMQLTEQILDSSKSEKEEKKLQVAPGDLSVFIQTLVNNFRFIAYEKGITIEVQPANAANGYFDAEKVETIVCNLISNAIKYTPEKGEISVTLSVNGDNVQIEVKDTGIGIPPEKREQIFKRFDRLDVNKLKPGIAGSGIGLHYAQYLAHLHKGNISYTPNTPDGSCFMLAIPFGKDAYSEEEQAQESPYIISSATAISDTTSEKVPQENTILIVEDNMDVRNYLQDLLSGYCNTMTAQDGEEALECLTLNIPDLIVSDVVMPRKDGFELCTAIKDSPDYGHIPIILLTAKSDINSNIKGLDCGADAYVNKPFDPFYLKAVIENLIMNRKRIQQIILNLTSGTIEEEKAQEAMLNEHDRVFLENLHTQMDRHLADEEFNINVMAREMGVSYSSLYAKIKSLTGQTPQTFFITYRMNVAMKLLKTRQYTVSEVCYKVGASSLANFSRSFKRQFGIPPSAV